MAKLKMYTEKKKKTFAFNASLNESFYKYIFLLTVPEH